MCSDNKMLHDNYYHELFDRFQWHDHDKHFNEDVNVLLKNASHSSKEIAIITKNVFVTEFLYDCCYPYLKTNPDILFLGNLESFFVVNLDVYRRLNCSDINQFKHLSTSLPQVLQTEVDYYSKKSNIEQQNNHLKDWLYKGWSSIYLFNTETRRLPSSIKNYTVDSFSIVSSGFIGFWYMNEIGYKEQPCIIYDINNVSVLFKKFLLVNWKGPSYISFAEFLQSIPMGDDVFHHFLNNTIDETTFEHIEKLWADEMAHWESLNAFQDFWDTLRNAERHGKINFYTLDLLFNPKSIEIINNNHLNEYQFLYISNIFNNRLSRWYFDFDFKKMYEHSNNLCSKLLPKTIIMGGTIEDENEIVPWKVISE